ncbi:hypothetical protein COCC4DRAFT_138440 [Bipolaris maydis ATCC 48331]|uniref:Uncharacterized protein n=2 Tax=Cochliobolus heterostrophus TaxID=5016 RepID=M2UME6_COCH5|nr:uncharacterized protein COCC4DRAFT_138440 [Bipolaris maydis ATCC 48331]EMD89128.1 hypothetical protein COCHEDRAFT_1108588 [Bipolaris maydis C5]ENI05152.1 hypothetical protein COCC4DRAFT_138440 [Bipolaris maydis ATCC 48331]
MSCLSSIRSTFVSIFKPKKKTTKSSSLAEKSAKISHVSPRPSISTSTQTSNPLCKPPLHQVPSAIVAATEKGMISASLCSIPQSPPASRSLTSTTTQTTSASAPLPFPNLPLASPSPLSLSPSSSPFSPFSASPVSPVSEMEQRKGEKRKSSVNNSTTTLTRGEEACVSGQSSRRTSVRFKGLDV